MFLLSEDFNHVVKPEVTSFLHSVRRGFRVKANLLF